MLKKLFASSKKPDLGTLIKIIEAVHKLEAEREEIIAKIESAPENRVKLKGELGEKILRDKTGGELDLFSLPVQIELLTLGNSKVEQIQSNSRMDDAAFIIAQEVIGEVYKKFSKSEVDEAMELVRTTASKTGVPEPVILDHVLHRCINENPQIFPEEFVHKAVERSQSFDHNRQQNFFVLDVQNEGMRQDAVMQTFANFVSALSIQARRRLPQNNDEKDLAFFDKIHDAFTKIFGRDINATTLAGDLAMHVIKTSGGFNPAQQEPLKQRKSELLQRAIAQASASGQTVYEDPNALVGGDRHDYVELLGREAEYKNLEEVAAAARAREAEAAAAAAAAREAAAAAAIPAEYAVVEQGTGPAAAAATAAAARAREAAAAAAAAAAREAAAAAGSRRIPAATSQRDARPAAAEPVFLVPEQRRLRPGEPEYQVAGDLTRGAEVVAANEGEYMDVADLNAAAAAEVVAANEGEYMDVADLDAAAAAEAALAAAARERPIPKPRPARGIGAIQRRDPNEAAAKPLQTEQTPPDKERG